MKRICYLLVLMALSSSAHAGNSISFVVGGHRVHVEAPQNCNSVSCVSVSIPGIYQTLRKLDRDDDVASVPEVAPVKPVAEPAQPALPTPIVAPAKPAIAPVACAPSVPQAPSPALPVKVEPAAPPKVEAAAPPAPPAPSPEPAKPAPATLIPALAAAMPSAVDAAPKVQNIAHDADDEVADTPLGVWQPEGKNELVRIERCGRALCGYVLKSSTGLSGEPVLINMKAKADSEWSGNIYSRDSGNAYYATIVMKGTSSLRVEACALGRFFCSANVWSRIEATPQKLISSRQPSSQPRS